MKSAFFKMAVVAGLVFGPLTLAAPARADVLVSFWHIDSLGAQTQADSTGKPAGPANASFVYTGPLNWFNPGPQNGPDPTKDLVGNFLGSFSNPGLITNFTTSDPSFTLADFNNTS